MFYQNTAFVIEDIFRIKRKADIRYTKRRDFCGLAFRISGSSVFVQENKSEVYAGEGSITFIPKGVDFETRSEDEEIVILHLAVYEPNDDTITSFIPGDRKIFADLFCNAEKEWQERKTGYKNRCASILYTIFENIEKNTEYTLDRTEELIKNGVDYMRRHFDECGLTVKTLAEQCSISEVYFRKIYKVKYGESPLKTLNRLRIERACGLLKSGYFNVTQTSLTSGFEDVKYFSTIFKKYMGVSPSEYKTKNEL